MGIVSDAVSALIAAEGLGVEATDLFSDHLPPDPDTVTAVLEFAGGPQPHTLGDQPPNPVFARIQVVVRGPAGNYSAGFDRAWLTWKLLAGAAGRETTTGTTLQSCQASSVPILLEVDSRDRRTWSFDLEACAQWA